MKTTDIAKDDIKVSVVLANKYEVKAKNFFIPISGYGNELVVTPRLFPSLFLFFFFEAFFTAFKEQKAINEIQKLIY